MIIFCIIHIVRFLRIPLRRKKKEVGDSYSQLLSRRSSNLCTATHILLGSWTDCSSGGTYPHCWGQSYSQFDEKGSRNASWLPPWTVSRFKRSGLGFALLFFRYRRGWVLTEDYCLCLFLWSKAGYFHSSDEWLDSCSSGRAVLVVFLERPGGTDWSEWCSDFLAVERRRLLWGRCSFWLVWNHLRSL